MRFYAFSYFFTLSPMEWFQLIKKGKKVAFAYDLQKFAEKF